MCIGGEGGAPLAVFFFILPFCVRLFLAARANLGLFHSGARCTYAQVSDSRRASPTRRVRIFCIRTARGVFGGRIRERGSRRLALCTWTGASARRTMRKWGQRSAACATRVIRSERTHSDTELWYMCASWFDRWLLIDVGPLYTWTLRSLDIHGIEESIVVFFFSRPSPVGRMLRCDFSLRRSAKRSGEAEGTRTSSVSQTELQNRTRDKRSLMNSCWQSAACDKF